MIDIQKSQLNFLFIILIKFQFTYFSSDTY